MSDFSQSTASENSAQLLFLARVERGRARLRQDGADSPSSGAAAGEQQTTTPVPSAVANYLASPFGLHRLQQDRRG